jgi:hypothetical protein
VSAVKKGVLLVLAAVAGIGIGVLGLAARKPISPDNPFANRYISVLELVTEMRTLLQPHLIEINSKNPLDARYFHILYLLGYSSPALAQLWETCKTKAPTTLEEVLNITYLGGVSKVVRLLLVFRFPDEATVLPRLVLDKPDWWDQVVKK